MQNKYLVSLEFRYSDASIDDDESFYVTKNITIGVYDNFNEARISGNNVLEIMENKFELHEYPNGKKANRERFNKKKKLIANLAYLKTPFTFYAKITELNYDDIDNVIDNVLGAVKRYKDYEKNLD